MIPVLALLTIYTLGLYALTVAALAYFLRDFTERIIEHTLHTRDHPKRDNGSWGD